MVIEGARNMYLRAFGESKDNATSEYVPSHVFVVPVVVYDTPEMTYIPPKQESDRPSTLLELDASLSLDRSRRVRRRSQPS
jgi:hypothetical protein